MQCRKRRFKERYASLLAAVAAVPLFTTHGPPVFIVRGSSGGGVAHVSSARGMLSDEEESGMVGGGKTAVAKAKRNLDQTIYNSIHSLLEYMICMVVINIKLLWLGTVLKNLPWSVGDSGLMRSRDRREMKE
jgi:hypothetical protein